MATGIIFDKRKGGKSSNLPAIEPTSTNVTLPPSVELDPVGSPGAAVATPGLVPMRVLAEGGGNYLAGLGSQLPPDALQSVADPGSAAILAPKAVPVSSAQARNYGHAGPELATTASPQLNAVSYTHLTLPTSDLV